MKLMCKLLGCKFNIADTECKLNRDTGMFTVTEICYKCGKKHSFNIHKSKLVSGYMREVKSDD